METRPSAEILFAQTVLSRHYPHVGPAKLHRLGGGFSGAWTFRAETTAGRFALRRWPQEHPSPERLTLIHDVLRCARRQGLRLTAIPIPSSAGRSFVEHDGRLWELMEWMPGEASYWSEPSPVKLTSALESLAQFHSSVIGFSSSSPSVGVSPGLNERLALLDRRLAQPRDRYATLALNHNWPELRPLARELERLFWAVAEKVRPQLAWAATQPIPLLPCLRDIWHDHVLFEGATVTGLIDYGSLRVESPAGDIARLLGSLVQDDRDGWQQGIAASQAVRPLSDLECQLIEVFDRSSTLLSGLNWLEWILVEGRKFGDRAAVIDRIEMIRARLNHLAFRHG